MNEGEEWNMRITMELFSSSFDGNQIKVYKACGLYDCVYKFSRSQHQVRIVLIPYKLTLLNIDVILIKITLFNNKLISHTCRALCIC